MYIISKYALTRSISKKKFEKYNKSENIFIRQPKIYHLQNNQNNQIICLSLCFKK